MSQGYVLHKLQTSNNKNSISGPNYDKKYQFSFVICDLMMSQIVKTAITRAAIGSLLRYVFRTFDWSGSSKRLIHCSLWIPIQASLVIRGFDYSRIQKLRMMRDNCFYKLNLGLSKIPVFGFSGLRFFRNVIPAYSKGVRRGAKAGEK